MEKEGGIWRTGEEGGGGGGGEVVMVTPLPTASAAGEKGVMM